jgi:hypothetical protein
MTPLIVYPLRILPLVAILSLGSLVSSWPIAISVGVLQAQDKPTDDLAIYREAAAKWEKDVAAFETLDEKEVADSQTLLFLGSSSVRLWDSIEQDLKPWKSLRRGYGGAKFSDLVVYTSRLVKAHQPRGVVIYVGNDIVGKASTDKTPTEVVRLFERVVADIRNHASGVPIFLIAITPAPSRFEAWPTIREANQQLEAACKAGSDLHFIATETYYLTSEGKPRPELFRDDRLHQNADGYKLWSSIIRAKLEERYEKRK